MTSSYTPNSVFYKTTEIDSKNISFILYDHKRLIIRNFKFDMSAKEKRVIF
ncbi:hypothetical protein C7377_0338 [Balneicella halophila]|uniref:Uncharacterized protein n=1 Tax=Balneicella halophila TaxID=1537566 RepID=A0A7L4UQL6_BALHA|nr:hypothetical protein C7377_0338 [Balneicella halophila]